jgi:hypothetical protein
MNFQRRWIIHESKPLSLGISCTKFFYVPGLFDISLDWWELGCRHHDNPKRFMEIRISEDSGLNPTSYYVEDSIASFVPEAIGRFSQQFPRYAQVLFDMQKEPEKFNRPIPREDRSLEDEIIKFYREGELRTLSIWEVESVECEYVKENPFALGSRPYYHIKLMSGEYFKVGMDQLPMSNHPGSPYPLEYDSGVLSALSDCNYSFRQGKDLARTAWKYSDWAEIRYNFQLCKKF